jgi:MFS family permease
MILLRLRRYVLPQGLSYIGFMDVFARWAPPNERVRLITFSSLGYGLGFATNYPISGFVIQYFGWQTLFYSSGKF